MCEKIEKKKDFYYAFLLFLSCSVSSNIVFLFSSAQTRDILDQIPLTVANVGDNFTMTCPLSDDDAGLFYWYKQKFGYMVQTVAIGVLSKLSLQGLFNNSRFTVAKVDALYFLNITNVCKEDEATYFCQAGAVYRMKFTNATVLVVNGKVCISVCMFDMPVSMLKQSIN